MTDVELLHKILRRDQDAFDLFYEKYAQVIYSLCMRILRDPAEAEDAMQEIFAQIWRDAGRFDPARASAKVWLFTIARSRSLDRYRSRRKNMLRIDPSPVEEQQAILTGENVERSGALRSMMANAMRRLTLDQRQALELSYFDGLTQEEIARHLNEPLGTIKTRIRSGLLRLRSFLSGDKDNG